MIWLLAAAAVVGTVAVVAGYFWIALGVFGALVLAAAAVFLAAVAADDPSHEVEGADFYRRDDAFEIALARQRMRGRRLSPHD